MADSGQKHYRERFTAVIETAWEVVDTDFYTVRDFDVSKNQIKLQVLKDDRGSSESVNESFANRLEYALKERYPDRRYLVKADCYKNDNDWNNVDPNSYFTVISRFDA